MEDDGKIIYFQVCGIDGMSTEVSKKSLQTDKGLNKNLISHAIKRPTRKIDVLIGFNYAELHLLWEQSTDHLFVFGNKFGKLIGGSYSLLKQNTQKIIQHSFVFILIK